jgi:putative SOS response-associated peptidase YedK
MCGRYVSPDEAALERALHVGRRNGNPFARKFNVFPTDTVALVLAAREAQGLEALHARWGLVPHWWKEAKLPARPNHIARVEEASGKPTWRDAWRRARCLIPAEGWYEWQQLERIDAATGEVAKLKQPHYVRRADGALSCFAGLMAYWTNPASGETLLSCAILTVDATGALADVHERAPVVLPESLYEAWLDRRLTDPAKVQALTAARLAPGAFAHHKVRPLVNNARADGPELIEPLAA